MGLNYEDTRLLYDFLEKLRSVHVARYLSWCAGRTVFATRHLRDRRQESDY